MSVDFNNVRKQALFAYESLVNKLNEAIVKKDQYVDLNDEDSININGYVVIDVEYIQKNMDSLRSFIGIMAMTSIEGDEDFKDVYEEVFPEEEEKSMICFNPESE